MRLRPSSIVVAIALFGCVSHVAPAAAADAPAYHVGQPVTSFTLNDDHGQPVSLSKYAGKIVVLNFYASW